MAKDATYTRRINLYINGKEIKNDVKSIKGEMMKLINAQSRMTIGSKEYAATGKKIQALNAILKKHRQELYGTSSRWDRLTKKLGGFKTIFIAAFSGAVIKAFSVFINKTKEFEKALSSLSAITGATGADLEFLGDSAIKMSKKSTKSANEIVKAMELIASSKPELLKNKKALADVTEQTIMLAEASGMELPDAASNLTKAMNQFGLSADEAGRTVNVLAAGSKEGAAAVPEITDAILQFGTVADSANISLEESVGVIETLAEKGINGAEAGTKLRNILVELQKGADDTNPKIVGLKTALENLGKENLSTAEMAKRFGKENLVAAQILVKSADKVGYYTEKVTGTSVAQEQQIKQTRNLSSIWKNFQNRLDSFFITVGKNSSFNDFLSGIIRSGSKIIEIFTQWAESPVDKAIRDEQKEVHLLAMRLTDANTSTNERRKILEKLKQINPDIIKGLEAENLNYKQLRKNINAYNEEVTNRMILASLQKEEEDSLSKLAEARIKEAEDWVSVQELIIKANKDIAYSEGTKEDKLKATISYLKKQVELQREAGKTGTLRSYGIGGTSVVDTRTEEQKLLSMILNQQFHLNNATKERINLEKKGIDYQKRVDALKDVLGITTKITEKTKETTDEQRTQTAEIEEQTKEKTKQENEELKKLKKYQAEKEKAEKNLADKIKDIRRQLHIETLTEEEQEKQKVMDKYADLIATAKEYGLSIKELEDLRAQEISAIDDKYAKKRLEKKKEVEEEIFKLTASEKEIETAEIRKKYEELIKLAEQYGLDTVELYARMKEELKAINETDEDVQPDILGMTPEDWENMFSNFDKAMEYVDQIGMAWGAMNKIMDNKDQRSLQNYESNIKKRKELLNKQLKDGTISQEQYTAQVAQLDADLDKKKAETARKQAKREKELAIFSALINTATAIMRIWADVPKMDFGASTLILTGLATAVGALQVAAIASQPLPQYAAGGFTDGARVYIAGEKGTEWIASNDMVTDPYTGPVIAALEAIRSGNAPASIFGGITPDFNSMQTNVPAFAEGGYTAGGTTTNNYYNDNLNNEMLAAVVERLDILTAYLADPANRRAYITHDELERTNTEDEEREALRTIK